MEGQLIPGIETVYDERSLAIIVIVFFLTVLFEIFWWGPLRLVLFPEEGGETDGKTG